METFKMYFTKSRPFRGYIPSNTSSKIYEALPSEEYEDVPISQGTFESASHRKMDASTSLGRLRVVEHSLPVDRFSLETEGSKSACIRLIVSSTISVTTVIATLLHFLLPSFIQPLFIRHSKDQRKGTLPKIQSTTYLNGVRGLAAFFVYNQHYAVAYYPYMDNGYMSSPNESRYLQMPIIRILYSGRFMVAIFFVLSGFVLSCKPLQLLRKQDPGLLENLASSAFRRTPRLFLPCIAPMFAASICVYNDWYGIPGSNTTDPNFAPKYSSFLGQAFEEWRWFALLVNPFTWAPYQPPHTPQLWTLPMEFRGSMVVFLSLLSLSKTNVLLRMSFLACFACYALVTLHWDTFLFIGGILFAEMHHIKKESSFCLEGFLRLLKVQGKGPIQLANVILGVFWFSTFLIGLFLGSWPVFFSNRTPGLKTLDQLTPPQYGTPDLHGFFWNSIGAVLVMAGFENLPLLQRPFVTPFLRYLGDISFSFYIVHWTVVWSIGRYITNETIVWIDHYHWGFLMGWVVVTPMTIWVADVHWRMFDDTSVRFSRLLWEKCSISKSKRSTLAIPRADPGTEPPIEMFQMTPPQQSPSLLPTCP